MNRAEELIRSELNNCLKSLEGLLARQDSLSAIAKASEAFIECFKNGGRIYACGNGGSFCDAQHFAEELSGVFRQKRPPLPAMVIGDPAHITCTGNDLGFEEIFSRFVEAFGKKGDVLFVISTSGKSPNCLKAAQMAQKKEMTVVSLTGREGSPLSQYATIDVCTPAVGPWADRIQELHIKCIHILIHLCEEGLFSS